MLFQPHFFPFSPLGHFLTLLQFHKSYWEKRGGITLEWFLNESSKGSLKKSFFFFFFLKERATTPEHLQWKVHLAITGVGHSKGSTSGRFDYLQVWVTRLLCLTSRLYGADSCRVSGQRAPPLHFTVIQQQLPIALCTAQRPIQVSIDRYF